MVLSEQHVQHHDRSDEDRLDKLWPLCAAGSRRSGRHRSRSGTQRLPLRPDELTIVRWIEVEKRPTRSKMLDENLTDDPGGAGGDHRHRQHPDRRTDYGQALHEAGRSGGGARRDYRSHQAGKDRFAPISENGTP
jgi:hypothetical protein